MDVGAADLGAETASRAISKKEKSMREPTGATDMRRRSFLKLLGLAGVAATVPMDLLIEPEEAVVEAANAAGVPVAGDFWWIPTQSQARRMGKILSITVIDPPPQRYSIPHHPFFIDEELSDPPQVHMELVDCDLYELQEAMINRESGKCEIYLFDRKFTVQSAFFQRWEHCIPMDGDIITSVELMATYPDKAQNSDLKLITEEII